MSFLEKIFGSGSKAFLKKVQPQARQINDLEKRFQAFSDEKLREKAQELKKKIENGRSLDDLLTEAFGLVREASKRTLGQRHFDVQLMAGIAMHQKKVVEMKTGEGKTLAATLPGFLNALLEKGVHIVTVNDYLARRDTVWMGQIYHFLGLSVGCLNHEQAFLYDPSYQRPDDQKDMIRDELGGFKVVQDFLRPCSRRDAYGADITYGTNNEFGFDFLRDNMVFDPKDRVQKALYFAIVDEIDSILIDEARTPLIISAPDIQASARYKSFSRVVPLLRKDEDYEIDEEKKVALLTPEGIKKTERILGLENIYRPETIDHLYHLEQALRAEVFFQRDRDYVIKAGQVIIVDEFTGRLMPGRRWSGGLHQAVEAKEKVEIQPESRTLATITFQNYFRLYEKLTGMTGTAMTSAEEFDKVYHLESVAIPTNRSMIRKDLPDRVYKTEKGKFQALVQEIKQKHEMGQPLLIGTRSIEKNEYLSQLLEKEGIRHQVLNAKHHEKEAEIIAQAGRLKAVTIATNMAGRGVDIILGGYPTSTKLGTGGSRLKTEKKELEPDSVNRLEWRKEHEKVVELGGLHVIGTERHEARRIDNQLRGRSGRQGDPGSSRFSLSLEDDLLRIFGGERIKGLMERLNLPDQEPIEAGLVSKAVEASQAKIEGLHFEARKSLLEYDDVMVRHREVFYQKRKDILEARPEKIQEDLLSLGQELRLDGQALKTKAKKMGPDFWNLAKMLYLRTLDFYWTLHLEDMEWLRESVGLRAYGNLNPLVEYKNEGYEMFREMMREAKGSLVKILLGLESVSGQASVARERPTSRAVTKSGPRVGRNSPCPCGKTDPKTGKRLKYKKCCGAI